MNEKEPGIILLAAGSSARMGRSKQLLPVDGEPLLLRTIKTALTTRLKKVIVVLGAKEKEHLAVIKDLSVTPVYNTNWEKGMGSSLKTGLNYLLSTFPATEGVIVLVCDQPLLSAKHIRNLILTQQQTGKPIIASKYGKTYGVPAFFEKSLFSQLAALEDGQGAKKIITDHPDQAGLVDFPQGAIDLDTPEDYNNFLSQIK